MASVELRHVNKVFADGTTAVDDLSLEIPDGEFMVLVGPSGCGKTTALRMLAGLESVTGGDILIGGRPVSGVSPQHRNVAMVFQNYALYPHMTVRKNMEFPLRMLKLPREERARRVARAAELLGLEEQLDRRPASLSGGQRQRVAMGRAIVRDPSVFLMDEPLSNLDAKLRVQIRTEIAALQRRMEITTVYVTHDQVEAMTLGHRVAVLDRGRLQQVSSPAQLYQRPANTFVAGFIGSPPMNLFDGRLCQGEAGLEVELGGQRIPVGPEVERCQPGIGALAGEAVVAGIRPDAFSLATDTDAHDTLEVEIEAVEHLGNELLLYFRLAPHTEHGSNAGVQGSGVARLGLSEHRFEPRSVVRLQLSGDALYFFLPSGEAVS